MLSFQSHSVRVFIVAPPMVSWGLERLLASVHPRFELMGVAGGLEEALPMVGRELVDVVLLDLAGNESAVGIEELVRHTQARPVLITASCDQAMLDGAVLAGVRGIIKRSEAPATLLNAMEKVHDGEVWIDRHATGRIFMEMARQKAAAGKDPEQPKISTLTARERQTIAAVASDASVPAKVIAARLCISEHTLRNHLTSIYSKLNVSNRLDLYAYATRHRLNKPEERERDIDASPRRSEDGHGREAAQAIFVRQEPESASLRERSVRSATLDLRAVASRMKTPSHQAA